MVYVLPEPISAMVTSQTPAEAAGLDQCVAWCSCLPPRKCW